jgi:hypothetical protein
MIRPSVSHGTQTTPKREELVVYNQYAKTRGRSCHFSATSGHLRDEPTPRLLADHECR